MTCEPRDIPFHWSDDIPATARKAQRLAHMWSADCRLLAAYRLLIAVTTVMHFSLLSLPCFALEWLAEEVVTDIHNTASIAYQLASDYDILYIVGGAQDCDSARFYRSDCTAGLGNRQLQRSRPRWERC